MSHKESFYSLATIRTKNRNVLNLTQNYAFLDKPFLKSRKNLAMKDSFKSFEQCEISQKKRVGLTNSYYIHIGID
jgi:hypothetical protein